MMSLSRLVQQAADLFYCVGRLVPSGPAAPALDVRLTTSASAQPPPSVIEIAIAGWYRG
jgi:hypothetical protein